MLQNEVPSNYKRLTREIHYPFLSATLIVERPFSVAKMIETIFSFPDFTATIKGVSPNSLTSSSPMPALTNNLINFVSNGFGAGGGWPKGTAPGLKAISKIC
jgi:hypothetical protein